MSIRNMLKSGWLRRNYEFRKRMWDISWKTPDNSPFPPVTLFDFARPFDADAWKISDDRVIGGYSSATSCLVRTTACWKNHLRDQQQQQHQGETNETPQDEQDVQNLPQPFLRWSGTLDTTIGMNTKVKRSGFCAIRSPEFGWDGADLESMYQALEISCKSNTKRVFTVNLKVHSTLPQDLYQAQILLEPSLSWDEFAAFVVPFSEFELLNGRRNLDDSIRIESIGLVLKDDTNGPFELDLARIRAVNLLDNNKVYEGPNKVEPKEQ